MSIASAWDCVPRIKGDRAPLWWPNWPLLGSPRRGGRQQLPQQHPPRQPLPRKGRQRPRRQPVTARWVAGVCITNAEWGVVVGGGTADRHGRGLGGRGNAPLGPEADAGSVGGRRLEATSPDGCRSSFFYADGRPLFRGGGQLARSTALALGREPAGHFLWHAF